MTEPVSPPAPVTVPIYPALGSANFNSEAYAYGSAMPAVAANINATGEAAYTNAVAAKEKALAAAASEAAATTNADLAMGYRNTAQLAAAAAADAQTAAQAALDSFDDRYLGQKPANPATDNDGGALVIGALYFRTTAPIGMKVWTGTAWDDAYANLSSKFDKTGGVISGNVNIPSLNGGQLAGLRNKIINGACEVTQRGAAPAVLGAWTYGGADRIAVLPVGFSTASGTIFQTLGYVSYYLGQGVALTTTGSGSVNFETRLESRDVIDLNSKTVTFSVRVWHDTGSAVNVTLTLTKANAEDNFTSKTTIASLAPVSVATSTATYLTLTVPLGSTDASNGLSCQVNFTGVGAVTNKVFMTSEWQLEVGSVATPFEHRPYGLELALCQRYYQRLTIGTNQIAIASADTATAALAVVPLIVPMRQPPLAFEQSGVATDYRIRAPGATSITCSDVPILVATNKESVWLNFTVSSGLTAGQAVFVRGNSASAYVGFSAEL